QGQGQAGQGGGGQGAQPGDGNTGTGSVQDPAGEGAQGQGPEHDTVFAPPRVGGDEDEWYLGGQDSGQGPDAQVGRGLGAGDVDDALVPYTDVLGSYRDIATRTIERPGFPVGRRDLVRLYFDQLAR
ncbi:MAG: hypothetical protein WD378_02980, partial [Egicoccus sp.]